MKRPIFLSIISIGGLCNRMRTMAGVIKLAKQWNARVVFVWVEMPDMNCPFSSLFQHFPYKVIDLKCRRSLFKVLNYIKSNWRGEVIDDSIVYNNFKGEDRGTKYLNGILGKNLFIWTCENITDSRDYSAFVPSSRITSNLDTRIDENTIGLHIRRTDSEKSILNSPTSLFVEKINEEMAKNKDAMFYLATDDISEENMLQAKFPGKLIVYNKRSLDRNSSYGIQDALIDLVNLSKCKYLVGSYWSSFSDVAADWGRIEKFVVKSE